MPKIKIAVRLLLLLILVSSSLTAFPQSYYAGDLNWSRTSTPTNGASGRWVLAEGSDIDCLEMAADGALYCSANPAGTTFRLFKSADGGKSWYYRGCVTDNIADIAVLHEDSNYVLYATAAQVFISSDAGENFTPLPGSPGGSGTANIEITSLDVASADGGKYIAVGTRDNRSSQYGGVYIWDENRPLSWQEYGAGTQDIVKVAFSPDFATDHQLITIGTDEKDTIISSRSVGEERGFGTGEARLVGLTPVSAEIAFPKGYSSDCTSGKYIQYISINTGSGQGGLFRLNGQEAPAFSTVTNLKVGGLNPLDISSLAIYGDSEHAKILAGAVDSTSTYFSDNAGLTWSTSIKPPSGEGVTGVLMANDYSTSGLIYASTKGTESAFSVSMDKGSTWNQSGLIDTRISAILGLAASPDYSRDNRLFMLTTDIQDSVWYSSDGGGQWQRIYCTNPVNSEKIEQILLSPKYKETGTVLLAGTYEGSPVIWKSEDNGKIFNKYDSVDPETGSPVYIDKWIFGPDDVLFVGSYDGEQGLVYSTAPNSSGYVDRGSVGDYVLSALVVSPDYLSDHTILVGNIFGGVFFSTDNGRVFEPLLNAADDTFTGVMSIAFDPGYAQNKTVFAADNTTGSGIFRFVIGQRDSWDSIDNSLPDKARMGKIITSDNGALYALNWQKVDKARKTGGIERCLDATAATPLFETVNNGLDDGISLKKMWLQGNNLWATDDSGIRLLNYTDTLVSPICLLSPVDGERGLDVDSVDLTWEQADAEAVYQWQIDNDTNFNMIADKYEGITDVTKVNLSNLKADTIYYWRVRASGPVVSPWSTVRSFDTIRLKTPTLSQPGFDDICSNEPVFKWSASEGAAQYELHVSQDEQFTDLVIDKLCSEVVWKSDIALQHNTGYYWKVRAVSGENSSDWSAASIFTSEAEPVPELDTPQPSQPKFDSTTSLTPIFRWSACEGASQYFLLISMDIDFTDIALDTTCDTNFRECAGGLNYSSHYYWKVKAANQNTQSAWSVVYLFNTEAEPIFQIEAPDLSKPKSGSACSVSPVFEWSVSANALKYELLVSKADNFTNPVINKTGDTACNANTWACDLALEYNASYYWKVRAVKGEAKSDWSAVWVFTTEAAPIPTPTPSLASPRPNSPVSSNSASTEPVFKWSDVEGANHYQLVVSKYDTFAPLEIDVICYSNDWKCSKTLTYQTAYYWKVRAVKGETQSDWSDVNAFTTQSAPSGVISGGSSSSSPKETLTPKPTPTQTPTPTPTPTPSPTTTPSPSARTSPLSGDLPTSPQTTHSPSAVAEAPTGAIAALDEADWSTSEAGGNDAPSDPTTSPTFTTATTIATRREPANSSIPVIYLLIGGLVVLTPTAVALNILRKRLTKKPGQS